MMPRRLRTVISALAVAVTVAASAPASAQSLRGSSSSLDIQNRIAREHDFTYIRTSSQVRRFVSAGYLVPVRGNADFDLHAVSFPYARPQVELFIRRLANQYRRACGEKLVVTSLTRPTSRQPRNASDRSVHPTGMAIDLRRSNDRACRAWLEDVLVSLERARVLEATRERYPPHYHVALFPQQYERYVERLASRTEDRRSRVAAEARKVATGTTEYRVRRGDSLWTIARRHGVSVEEIRSSNDLDTSRIYAGQLLRLPTRSR
jgi:LysM repeat protein